MILKNQKINNKLVIKNKNIFIKYCKIYINNLFNYTNI